MAEEFKILSFSHALVVALCVFLIIYIPQIFVGAKKETLLKVKFMMVALIITFQAFELYKTLILFNEPWQNALPIHMCDFSAFALVVYMLTGKKIFFNFAYFWGIAGAGMALITPDVLYGLPSVGYLANQYGHTIIILGVSFGLTVFGDRPYIKDIFTIFGWTLLMLIPIYLINYILYPLGNYWYTFEKPIGNNIIVLFLPDAPYHMIPLIPVAFAFMLLVYSPLYIKDKKNQYHYKSI